MQKATERRIRAVEDASVGTNTCEVWIELEDGMMFGPRGETISPASFEMVCSKLAAVVVLPDNKRDNLKQLSGKEPN
jgi:hypothetical protein